MGRLEHLAAPTQPERTGRVEYGPDGGEFTDIQTTEPLTDWTHVFERFNLDPGEFAIVGDTVRVSHWQQSARAKDGSRDLIDLYAYRAKFQRRTAYTDETTLTAMVERMRNVTTAPATPMQSPVTAFIGPADCQLGKSYGPGRGTAETIDRLNASKTAILAWLDQRKSIGWNIEKVTVANMGDLTEGVHGSYASQPYTVDLNLRDQLTLGIDVTLDWIKTFAPQAPQFEYAACLCNHGTLSRAGGRDNISDDADNAAGFIGDTARRVCAHIPGLSDTKWSIPRDNMITTTEASGAHLALAHGHKISGSEQTWLATQTNALGHQGYRPDLWVTAHRHSVKVDDYGPYRRIQCSTVDPGSKWFTDSTGVYATPGVVVFLAAKHLPFTFAELAVL